MRETTSGARAVAGRFLPTAGWLVVGPLLAVAVARVVAWDRSSVLVVLNALTPFLYLPAWPVAIAAGVARRWLLCAGAASVVVAHVVFVLPEVAAREDLPTGAKSAPKFRLFSANVFAGNRQVGTFAEEIGRARPDVVFLQEATPDFVTGLDEAGALAELPHRRSVPRDDPFAAFVASRWPLAEDEVVSVRGRPVAIVATISFRGEPVRLAAVHAVSPVLSSIRPEWIADLDRFAEIAAAENRPFLMAGDFNATWGHQAFRRLLDRGGLTDAAAARGDPFHMTWSRRRGVIPPMVRIDHVLTKGRLAVTRIDVGRGLGSDHRPLVADVALASL